jgi:hypothetical protein
MDAMLRLAATTAELGAHNTTLFTSPSLRSTLFSNLRGRAAGERDGDWDRGDRNSHRWGLLSSRRRVGLQVVYQKPSLSRQASTHLCPCTPFSSPFRVFPFFESQSLHTVRTADAATTNRAGKFNTQEEELATRSVLYS